MTSCDEEMGPRVSADVTGFWESLAETDLQPARIVVERSSSKMAIGGCFVCRVCGAGGEREDEAAVRRGAGFVDLAGAKLELAATAVGTCAMRSRCAVAVKACVPRDAVC